MSIHKSQGSEYEKVAIVLPDADHRILTRELLYTAVTRARTSILLYASPEALARAIETPTVRVSGLARRLWQDT
jgi:exodeoxyribonuclease V alpha subunit